MRSLSPRLPPPCAPPPFPGPWHLATECQGQKLDTSLPDEDTPASPLLPALPPRQVYFQGVGQGFHLKGRPSAGPERGSRFGIPGYLGCTQGPGWPQTRAPEPGAPYSPFVAAESPCNRHMHSGHTHTPLTHTSVQLLGQQQNHVLKFSADYSLYSSENATGGARLATEVLPFNSAK